MSEKTDQNRRHFLRQSAAGLVLGALPFQAARTSYAFPRPEKNAISLAIWSLNRSFRNGVWKLTDMARIVREDFGLDGIEYVNSFFEVPTARYLSQLNKLAAEHGVENVLIMVDSEGSMVAKDEKERSQAVINHRKWVDIAAYLGCHAIRCNAHGGGKTLKEDPDSLDRAAESFDALLEYAKPAKINVIIENHGGLSSQPGWLARLSKKIDSSHFGLLPDYGNFADPIDYYEATEEMMPYAKGVSVKAGFKADGSHPRYNIEKLLKISLKAGYSGFWGIESGMGAKSDSPDDVKAAEWKAVNLTKAAIEKVVFSKSTG